MRASVACAVAAVASLSWVPTVVAGSFRSSDPQLNAIWQASVKTADDMLAAGPLTVDAYGRPCAIDLAVVIVDGLVRDRCPYVGDESVIDAVYDASDPRFDVQRNMLAWFAAHQLGDGSIPSSPANQGQLVLFDYNAYWLMTLYRYVLYSGDIGFARTVWPHVELLVNRWYAKHTGRDGLLHTDLGASDYGYIRRIGTEVAYFNAQAVVALRDAAKLADWIGTNHGAGWRVRASALATAAQRFWDPAAGAFTDTTLDRVSHPQDGNVFAVLAGVGNSSEWRSAIAYIDSHEAQSYGDTLTDTLVWDGPAWGYDASMRVYPFIGYYDVLARFAIGDELGAIDLIRREWGYMLGDGGGAFWETIGPFGGAPVAQWPSWDSGWSAGAGAALTEDMLGIQPTSPGFATFTVTPHPGAVAWVHGTVDTPRGGISVSWTQRADDLALTVRAPPGEVWTNRPISPRRLIRAGSS